MKRILYLGRLDGYIIEDAVARIQIKTANFPLRSSIIKEQVSEPLYYMFSRKVSDNVVQRFNATIRRRLSGER